MLKTTCPGAGDRRRSWCALGGRARPRSAARRPRRPRPRADHVPRRRPRVGGVDGRAGRGTGRHHGGRRATGLSVFVSDGGAVTVEIEVVGDRVQGQVIGAAIDVDVVSLQHVDAGERRSPLDTLGRFAFTAGCLPARHACGSAPPAPPAPRVHHRLVHRLTPGGEHHHANRHHHPHPPSDRGRHGAPGRLGRRSPADRATAAPRPPSVPEALGAASLALFMDTSTSSGCMASRWSPWRSARIASCCAGRPRCRSPRPRARWPTP